MKKTFLSLLCLLFLQLNIFPQSQSGERQIKWQSNRHVKWSENSFERVFYFDGALYSDEKASLPVFLERFELSTDIFAVESEIKNAVFEEIEGKDLEEVKNLNLITEKIEINNSISYKRKVPYGNISFVPIRKNIISGKYERLISFNLEIISVGIFCKLDGFFAVIRFYCPNFKFTGFRNYFCPNVPNFKIICFI